MFRKAAFLFICSIVLPTACQTKPEQESGYSVPYKEYLKLSNYVVVHGETAHPDSLENDKYLEDNLNYLLQNYPWVLVNFSAYWCKDCRKFEPVYKEVASLPKYKNILFCYAEVDGTRGNEHFRARFGLPGVPVTILFHKGKIVEKNGQKAILFGQKGDKTKSDLIQILDFFYSPAGS